MSEMHCPELREVAPDVALGLLTGEERARALAHLECCETCRADVASLAATADEMLLAAPEAAPPPGFRERVLARIATERADGEGLPTLPVAPPGPERQGRGDPGRRRRIGARRARPAGGRRRRGAIAALAAALVLVVAGMAVGLVLRDTDRPVATAEMRTVGGRVVGEVAASGDPATVVVDVPGWRSLVESWGYPPGGYQVRIDLRDGSRASEPVPSYGHTWEVPVDAPAHDIVAVSMVDDAGRVWCTGRLE